MPKPLCPSGISPWQGRNSTGIKIVRLSTTVSLPCQGEAETKSGWGVATIGKPHTKYKKEHFSVLFPISYYSAFGLSPITAKKSSCSTVSFSINISTNLSIAVRFSLRIRSACMRPSAKIRLISSSIISDVFSL